MWEIYRGEERHLIGAVFYISLCNNRLLKKRGEILYKEREQDQSSEDAGKSSKGTQVMLNYS